MKRHVPILLGLLVVGACAQPALEPPDRGSESLAVVRAVLESRDGAPPFVIVRDRAEGDLGLELRELIEPLSDEAIRDWAARNAEPGELPFDDSTDFRAVSRAELEVLFEASLAAGADAHEKGEDGWAGFRSAFPGEAGYYTVSAVGFDDAGDEAVVFVTLACGGLCGWGRFFRLVRDGTGEWTVTHDVLVWIS